VPDSIRAWCAADRRAREAAMKRTLLATAMLAAGCVASSPPGTYAVEKSRAYAADFDTTWSAVMQFLSEQNWSIKKIEKASGIIAFEPLKVDESQCDCGRGGWAAGVESREAYLGLFVHHDSPTQTTVTANVSMKGLTSTAALIGNDETKYYWIDCASNGALERMLLDGIAAKVAPLNGAPTQ
jgi:hypothetical protein